MLCFIHCRTTSGSLWGLLKVFLYFLKFTVFILIVILFILSVQGLHCCAGFSLVAGSGGYSPEHELTIAVASLVAEHRL